MNKRRNLFLVILIEKGICTICVPVKKKKKSWVSIIYGIEDDFKTPVEENTATFLNKTFLSWMEDKGMLPTDLWEDNEPPVAELQGPSRDTRETKQTGEAAFHELWNARLFPFSTDPAESMRISFSFQDEENFQLERWREAPRMSLREILESVDYERFLNNYSNLCQKVNLESLATILTPKSELSSEEILSWCMEASDYTTAVKMTLALIEQYEDILFQARLYKLLSNILWKAHEHKKNIDFGTKAGIETLPAMQKATTITTFECSEKVESADAHLASLSESLEDIAFGLVREAIGKGLTLEHQSQRIQIRSDEV